MPDLPTKKAALAEIKIGDGTLYVEALSENPQNKADTRIAVGVDVNGLGVVVLYPQESNLAQAGAIMGDPGLLNALNAYSHAIAEGLRDQARHNVLSHARAILDALNAALPVSDNYINSQLEELREEVRILKEQLEKGQLSRAAAESFATNLQKKIAEGAAREIGKRIAKEIYPYIEPHVEKIIHWLMVLAGLSS